MRHKHADVHNRSHNTHNSKNPDLILEAERTSTDMADTSLTSLSDDFKDRLSLIWGRTRV